MMNQNTNNNGNRNTALETALKGIIKNCTNTISIDELIKLESFETRNLTEELSEEAGSC